MTVQYQEAKAVWPEGRREVWNQTAGFVLCWEAAGADALLRITGAD